MIKLADTLEPMADFPSAYAKDIAFNDGDTLQEKLDTGSLGGGVGYKQLSQAEYDALTEEEKMDGREYRTYDTGHIYKLGVEYGKDCDVQIDDVNDPSETSVWSSQKTSDEIAKVDDKVIETIANPTELDTNKYIKNGFYSIGDATKRTNLPMQNVGTLLVYYAGHYVVQEYILNANLRRFMRRSTDKGANWSAWQELATMDKIGELCNKKIYCGEVTGTTVSGVISTTNPIGRAGNAIVTMQYASRNPRGYSITIQVTSSQLNFYFRWHRESDDVEAYPPDGTEITISYMIFY